MIARLSAAALLAVALACATKRGAPQARPTGKVIVETSSGARHVVAVEVARTEEEHARGLMWREQLAPDAGMLFVFDESAPHDFWMKNTLIPLDMLFIDDDGRIVGVVERAEPRTLTSRSVEAPSRYVLEVNGGWAAAHGVRKGDRVTFQDVLL